MSVCHKQRSRPTPQSPSSESVVVNRAVGAPVFGPSVPGFGVPSAGYFNPSNTELRDTFDSLQSTLLRSAAQPVSANRHHHHAAQVNHNQMAQAIGHQPHFATDPAGIYSAGQLYLPSGFFPQSYPGINVRPFVAGPSDGLFPFMKLPDTSSAAAYRQQAAAGVTGLATALPFLSQVWNFNFFHHSRSVWATNGKSEMNGEGFSRDFQLDWTEQINQSSVVIRC